MKCPNERCGSSRGNAVIRTTDVGDKVLRERRCHECHETFFTTELHDDVVYKKVRATKKTREKE